MSSRVIPIKAATKTVPLVGEIRRDDTHWIDSRGRPLRDVRISITDRCNFRCRYCMPKEKFEKDHCFLSHTEVLSFEEIIRLGRIFAANGVEKIRLTGGEPLLRKGIEFLIEELSKLKTWNGKPLDVAVTTNGAALSAKAKSVAVTNNGAALFAKAKSLAAAGLKRLTVSLDAMDPQIYKDLNDVNFPIEKTLAGIQAAKDAGIPSIKINVVVKRSVNEKELIKIAEHFKGTGIIVRYIEFMDVGTSNGWRLDDVIPSRQIVEEINRVYPIEPLDPNYTGEVATRWAYKDESGELGFFYSVSKPFCKECSRIRLSVDGKLYKCLFATEGFDIRQMLRGGASDEEIEEAIGRIWTTRDEHYSEIRTEKTVKARAGQRIEMSYIGG